MTPRAGYQIDTGGSLPSSRRRPLRGKRTVDITINGQRRCPTSCGTQPDPALPPRHKNAALQTWRSNAGQVIVKPALININCFDLITERTECMRGGTMGAIDARLDALDDLVMEGVSQGLAHCAAQDDQLDGA